MTDFERCIECEGYTTDWTYVWVGGEPKVLCPACGDDPRSEWSKEDERENDES